MSFTVNVNNQFGSNDRNLKIIVNDDLDHPLSIGRPGSEEYSNINQLDIMVEPLDPDEKMSHPYRIKIDPRLVFNFYHKPAHKTSPVRIAENSEGDIVIRFNEGSVAEWKLRITDTIGGILDTPNVTLEDDQ